MERRYFLRTFAAMPAASFSVQGQTVPLWVGDVGGSFTKMRALAFQLGFRADSDRTPLIQGSRYRGIFNGYGAVSLAIIQTAVFKGARAIVFPGKYDATNNAPRSDFEERLGISLMDQRPGIPVQTGHLNAILSWEKYKVTLAANNPRFIQSLAPGPEYDVRSTIRDPRTGAGVCIAATRRLGQGEVIVVEPPYVDYGGVDVQRLPIDDENIDLMENREAAAAVIRWLVGQ